MKKNFVIRFHPAVGVLFMCITLSSLSAQKILIPYLSNDMYGFSDEKGKIIVQPAFEEVNVYLDLELIAFRQNGLWGIMDTKGSILFKPVIKVEVPKPNYSGRIDGPYIQRVFRKTMDVENEIFAKANLYLITDDYANLQYYINPFKPRDSYPAFVDIRKIKRESDKLIECKPGFTGIIKVGMRDQMFNFIDTSGRVLFKRNVYDGQAVSTEIIAVQNEQGMIGMVDINEQPISDFIYDQVIRDDGDFIIAIKSDSIKKSTKYYSLYTTSGKLILKDLSYRMETKGKIALIKENNISIMYNQVGVKVAAFEDSDIWPMSQEEELFLISIKKQFGIVDAKGNFILEPRYTSLKELSNGKFAFTLGKKGGLLDEKYNSVWTLDSIAIYEQCYGLPGYYVVQKDVRAKYGTKVVYGIADSLGNIVIPVEYKDVRYYPKSKVVEVRKDSLQSVISVAGKILVPFTKDHIEVEDSRNSVLVRNSEISKRLDISTMKSMDLVSRQLRAKVMKRNNLFYLANNEGIPLTESVYISLTPRNSIHWPGTVFVGNKTNAKDEFVDIFNEEGKNIIPAGYGVYAQHANQSIKRNLVTVFNKEDAIKINSGQLSMQSKFRSGAIDFNGLWIIPPDYQVLSNLGNEILRVGNLGTNKYSLYDFQGRLITSVNYTYVQDPKDDNFKFNRVIVGIPVDLQAYEAFVDKIKSQPGPEEMDHIMQDKNSVPKVMVGAIDLNGKEVIPLNYLQIDPFNYSYTSAKRIDKKKGTTYSVIIDTMGREMFRSEFENIHLMDGDSTQIIIETGNRKGVSELSGKVIIEPAYELIYYYKDIDGYIVRSQDSSYYISKKIPDIRIAIGRAGNPDYRSLDDQFFCTSMQDRVDYKKSYFHFFDKEGNYFGQFTANRIATNVFGAELPKGYIAVSETEGSKPYVVNLASGMKYRKN